MTYRLIALDLDGTVVREDLSIAPAVMSAIAAAQARGVYVTLATGRMFGATLPFAEQLHIDTALICYQGALVRDARTREIFAHTPMPATYAAEATAALVDHDVFVIAYIDERLCVAARRPELDIYLTFHPEGAEVVVAPDLPALVASNVTTKLLFVAEPEVVGRELSLLEQQFGEKLGITRSHQLFGELTAPGISKGVALAALTEHLGIRREEVIAIGDQENDLSMIEWAGLGLSMGNGIPALRAVADEVIPGIEEDGVAWAIKRYLL